MSFFLPVVRPARCAPRVSRNELAPLFSLLDDTFNEVSRASRHSRRPPFAPRFNVSEGSDYYSLEGELPGVEQENISVEFTSENTLTVKGRVEKQSQSGKAPAVSQAVEEAKPAEATEASAEASSETQSVQSHQATVEDEKEWTEVDAPASSEAAAPSTTTAQSEEASSSVAPAQSEQQQPEQPTSRPWLSERFVGQFSRSFSFSERVDQEAVRASLKNGILSIVVPKAAKPENRRISIE